MDLQDEVNWKRWRSDNLLSQVDGGKFQGVEGCELQQSFLTYNKVCYNSSSISTLFFDDMDGIIVFSYGYLKKKIYLGQSIGFEIKG